MVLETHSKRVESDSLSRRFAPLAAHTQRYCFLL